jgi:hypothetical protein
MLGVRAIASVDGVLKTDLEVLSLQLKMVELLAPAPKMSNLVMLVLAALSVF